MSLHQESGVLGVIPVRMTATRLPGKPLLEIDGKSMVERVYERVRDSRLVSKVVVATDSNEIREVAEGFGAEVVMTSSSAPSGSARVLEARETLGWPKDSLVINIQGDMPFLPAEVIDSAVRFFNERLEHFDIVTVATPIHSESEFVDPASVKVVLASGGKALYFSRAPIPYSRDGFCLRDSAENTVFGYRHLGLYIFRGDSLGVFSDTRLSSLEEIERLEQLRALEEGLRIGVNVIPSDMLQNSIEVDTPGDLDRARKIK